MSDGRSFRNGAIEIAYLDEGEGDPIILVHGFASNKNVNWVYPAWVSELRKNGHRAIALDNRGHGQSSRFYDQGHYSIPAMAGDVLALMDHLGIKRADVMGYSMGARIAAWLACNEPQRLRGVILAGIGFEGLIAGKGPGEAVAVALEQDSIDDITDPMGRDFRAFAERTRSDRMALAACLRATRFYMREEEMAGINIPVLIAVGTRDDVAGSAQQLAAVIPGSQLLDIPDRDHMRAVGDRVFKEGVLDFLSRL